MLDTTTGERLLRSEEVRELVRTTEARIRTAEEEAARLRAELERLRRQVT